MAEPKSYIDRTKAVVDPEEIRDPELRELVEKLGKYPYSDTSKTYAPNTRIYEHIKGCFPRRWRPQNRDSTWVILSIALKCRCRVKIFLHALLTVVTDDIRQRCFATTMQRHSTLVVRLGFVDPFSK